jgi:hypothetical protein
VWLGRSFLVHSCRSRDFFGKSGRLSPVELWSRPSCRKERKLYGLVDLWRAERGCEELQLWLTVELSYFVIQATNVDTALRGIAQKWLGRGRGTKLGIARTDAVWSIAYRTLEGTTCVCIVLTEVKKRTPIILRYLSLYSISACSQPRVY